MDASNQDRLTGGLIRLYRFALNDHALVLMNGVRQKHSDDLFRIHGRKTPQYRSAEGVADDG